LAMGSGTNRLLTSWDATMELIGSKVGSFSSEVSWPHSSLPAPASG